MVDSQDYELSPQSEGNEDRNAITTSRGTTEQEIPWSNVLDKNLSKAIDAFNAHQDRHHEIAEANRNIDKWILYVLLACLLGSLFFAFYLIAIDKLEAVKNILYPIITLILGFLSGYYAGTGRSGRAKNIQ